MNRSRLLSGVLFFAVLFACNSLFAGICIVSNSSPESVVLEYDSEGKANDEQVKLYPGETVSFGISLEKANLRMGKVGRKLSAAFSLEAYGAYYLTSNQDGLDLHELDLGLTPEERLHLLETAMPTGAELLILPVVVAVDEEQPAKDEYWQKQLTERIDKVSKVFELTARVRLKVVGYKRWNSNNQLEQWEQEREPFISSVKGENAPLVIGFSFQHWAPASLVLSNDSVKPLTSHLLLPLIETQQLDRDSVKELVLIHEIGHYLGAVHTSQPNSWMSPQWSVGSEIPRVGFDPLNAMIMNIYREELQINAKAQLSEFSEFRSGLLHRWYNLLNEAKAENQTNSIIAVLNKAKLDRDRAKEPLPLGSPTKTEPSSIFPNSPGGNVPVPFDRAGRMPLTVSDVLQEFGNVSRGRALFEGAQFNCQACHRSENQPARGPSLVGISKARSVAEIVRSILQPSAEISSEYASEKITTKRQRTYQGLVELDAKTGRVIVAQGAHRTVSIEPSDISERIDVADSIMNAYSNASAQDIADILSYVQTLSTVAEAKQLTTNSSPAPSVHNTPDPAASRESETKLRSTLTMDTGTSIYLLLGVVAGAISVIIFSLAVAQRRSSVDCNGSGPRSRSNIFLWSLVVGVLLIIVAIDVKYSMNYDSKSPAVVNETSLSSDQLKDSIANTAKPEPTELHEGASTFQKLRKPMPPNGSSYTELQGSLTATPHVQEIHIPEFPGGYAIWGATGRDHLGHIWFGVSASGIEIPSAHLMEYIPEQDQVIDRGDVVTALKTAGIYRPGEGQMKIHSKIVQAADGNLYFASLDEQGENENGSQLPRWGGHLWRYRLAEHRWEHLKSVPEALIAVATSGDDWVYALGYFDHVLYGYQISTQQLISRHVGSVGGHISRNLIVDPEGHVFVPRISEVALGGELKTELVEFDPNLNEFNATSLHQYRADRGANSHGITGFVHFRNGSTYFLTQAGFLYRLAPAGNTPAQVDEIGWFFGDQPLSAASLFTMKGSRYLLGAGKVQRQWNWIVFDTESQISVKTPLLGLENLKQLLLYGSVTRDNQGSFYLAGRHITDGSKRPILVRVSLPNN